MEKEILPLLEGYQKFRRKYFQGDDTSFTDLVRQGQRPKVLMVACSDARVDPALVLNCEPGDLFVVRNVANLVPPYEEDFSYHGTSAALEFGVCVLGIRHIILFGHTQCGGIQALLEGSCDPQNPNSFLAKWMEIAKLAREALQKSPDGLDFDQKTFLCGQHSLKNSLRNLGTFPWIAERVKSGSLFLHAWNFHMESGTLEAYDPESEGFRVLSEPAFFSHDENEVSSSLQLA